MKKVLKILIITLIFVLSGSIGLWAGEVTGLVEFQAGDPAVASEVNDNFNAVKAAVDDNDAAVTANSNSIVTNAGNISSNTDNLTSRTGVQEDSWSGVSVSSTSNITITRLKITDTDTYNVSLSAHLVIEINGTGGRYEFSIRRGSASGTAVGTAWWRPGSATGYQAVTISLTGFDASVAGPLEYHLCARKFQAGDPDGNIGFYGLNAQWSEHPTILIPPVKIDIIQ